MGNSEGDVLTGFTRSKIRGSDFPTGQPGSPLGNERDTNPVRDENADRRIWFLSWDWEARRGCVGLRAANSYLCEEAREQRRMGENQVRCQQALLHLRFTQEACARTFVHSAPRFAKKSNPVSPRAKAELFVNLIDPGGGGLPA